MLRACFALAALCAVIAAPGETRNAAPRTLSQTIYGSLPPWTARALWQRQHRFDGRAQTLQYNSPIQHVVVVVMENRSLDNLFSGLYRTAFGNSGSTWGSVVQIANPNGKPALAPIDFNQWGSPGHEHYDFENEANLATAAPYNPNWAADVPKCSGHRKNCVPSVFSFVNPEPEPSNGKIRQIWPYEFIAENFALADNMYQANQGPSLPAHQYLIAGQSGGFANNPKKQGPSTAPYALADNNVGGCGQVSGDAFDGAEDEAEPWHTESGNCGKIDSSYCVTGSPNHTASVDMADNYFSKRNLEYDHYSRGGNPQFAPCENYDTILDLLDASGQPGIWEYHAHGFGSYWNAPVLVSRFANCNGQWGHKNPPPQCDPVSQDVVDPEGYTFVTQEVAQGNLPAVTYLTPCPGDSDHPNSLKETGPSWVAWLINAIGQNPNLWPNTAVFVVWDDWGGWYDHIPPAFSANEILYPKPDAYEWGFRVPFLAVSAYPALGLTGAQGGYVSHQPRSMSAILTFIEDNFKIQGSGKNTLGSLGTDDALNDPLADLFDFSMPPRAWPTVPATDPFKPLLTKGRNPQPYCEHDPL